MSNISQIADDEIRVYSQPITIAEGLDVDFRHIFTKIEYYKRDSFLKCTDPNAIFWNVAKSRVTHFSKHIDTDTKDYEPYGQGKANHYAAYLLRQKFYEWARDNGFVFLLNNLADTLSEYGITIWKKYTDENKQITFKNISPLRVYWDVLAEDELQSPVIEEMFLTEREIRDKEDVWENVEDALEKAETVGQDYQFSPNAQKYKVYERIGDWEGERYRHIFVGKGDKSVVLYEEKLGDDEKIYYFFNMGGNYPLMPSVGVYERLFALQKEMNALVNQNADTRRIASTLLLRTNDPQTKGNILEGVENGEIINSQDLQEIPMSNRALSDFLNTFQVIEQQADNLCFTPAVVRGEEMPSGTPFRSTAVLSNTAKNAFRQIKTVVGEKIAYILLHEMFPSLVRKWNKEEIVKITGSEDDISEFVEQKVRLRVRKRLAEAAANGQMMTKEMVDQITDQLRRVLMQQGEFEESIPKGFFNFKYGLRLNITNEHEDLAQKNDAYSGAMNWILSNPNVMRIKLFRQYLENNNIDPHKITEEEIQALTGQAEKKTQGEKRIGEKQDTLLSQVNTA